MRAILFQHRFVSRLLDGSKYSTIRKGDPVGFFKRYKVRDVVSLRYWSGAPYRSPQVEFAQAWVAAVSEVHIDLEAGVLFTGGRNVPQRGCEALAAKEGFESWAEMLGWFRETHSKVGRHFFGACITFGEVIPIEGGQL